MGCHILQGDNWLTADRNYQLVTFDTVSVFYLRVHTYHTEFQTRNLS